MANFPKTLRYLCLDAGIVGLDKPITIELPLLSTLFVHIGGEEHVLRHVTWMLPGLRVFVVRSIGGPLDGEADFGVKLLERNGGGVSGLGGDGINEEKFVEMEQNCGCLRWILCSVHMIIRRGRRAEVEEVILQWDHVRWDWVLLFEVFKVVEERFPRIKQVRLETQIPWGGERTKDEERESWEGWQTRWRQRGVELEYIR